MLGWFSCDMTTISLRSSSVWDQDRRTNRAGDRQPYNKRKMINKRHIVSCELCGRPISSQGDDVNKT